MVVAVNSFDDRDGNGLRIVGCLPCWLFNEPVVERCVVYCESWGICIAYVMEVCVLCECVEGLVV